MFGERGLCIAYDGKVCGPEFLDSSILYINLLVCLIFVFLLFTKAFKQDNTRIANILAAIFSFWVWIYAITRSVLLADWFEFIDLFQPDFGGTFFVVGGIISTIYFSKYYGEIIIKFGIAIFTIQALIGIFEIIEDIFYLPALLTILSNVLVISFWFIYFKTLSSKTNVSFVSKNDPKDW